MPEKKDKKQEKEKLPTFEDYLAQGRINQKLYDDIQKIPTQDKKDRVLETMHRRLATRAKLCH